MEARELLEKVQLLGIFWEGQMKKVILLKPTTVLDEKDVVAFSEMANSRGEKVGIPATDAQDMWKSWSEAYQGILKLRSMEVNQYAKDMLEDIYGVSVKMKKEDL